MTVTNKLSIKVKVGDRTYPMTIDRQDEERMRDAAARVTEMYNRFSAKIAEPLDSMAFVALEMALRGNEKTMQKSVDNALKEITQICESIDELLEEK